MEFSKKSEILTLNSPLVGEPELSKIYNEVER